MVGIPTTESVSITPPTLRYFPVENKPWKVARPFRDKSAIQPWLMRLESGYKGHLNDYPIIGTQRAGHSLRQEKEVIEVQNKRAGLSSRETGGGGSDQEQKKVPSMIFPNVQSDIRT